MQYHARYTQRLINTMQYDARYTKRQIQLISLTAQGETTKQFT